MPDEHGYPTDEELETIKNWEDADFEGLARYCQSLWKWKECSQIYFANSSDCNNKADRLVWKVSTGGWSGHEEIIAALPQLWRYFFAKSWHCGGHYEYEGPVNG